MFPSRLQGRDGWGGYISSRVYTDETDRPPPLFLGTRFSDNKKELERRQREEPGNHCRSRHSNSTVKRRSSTCADCQLPHSRQLNGKKKKKKRGSLVSRVPPFLPQYMRVPTSAEVGTFRCAPPIASLWLRPSLARFMPCGENPDGMFTHQ